MNNNKKIVLRIPLNTIKFSTHNLNSSSLNVYLNWIRKLDQNDMEVKLGLWDSNLNYRRSNGEVLTQLDPYFYENRQVWNDFIFSLSINYESAQERLLFDPLSFQTFLYLRTLLKLFWRDIFYNLSPNVRIKIQLRAQLKKKVRFGFKYN